MNKDKISEKEFKLWLKIFQLRTHIEESNVLMEQLLKHPYDLSEHNQSTLLDIIHCRDTKEFNQLINKLDNKIRLNQTYIVYQKYEPQPKKRSISTHVNIGANPSIDIVTKKYRCIEVPIFI